jgi:HSP20 family protein
MFLRRLDPMVPFGQLRSEISRLLDVFDPFADGGTPMRTGRFPALNVWEDGQSVYAEAELPGVSHDDLDVSVVGNELTIKGSRKPMESKGVSYHRQERQVGEFTRVLTLPVDVDADSVQASLKDGVLQIKMPKSHAARPKKIDVKVG